LTAGFAVLMAVSAIWPVMAIVDLVSVVRGYPYANADPESVSPLGFNHRSDADYVAWIVSLSGVTFHSRRFTNDWDGGPSPGEWGEPGQWGAYAVRLGFTVDDQPSVGAVAEWTARDDAREAGHVAVVTRVWPDGHIDVKEYDLASASNGYTRHAYGERSGLNPADRYIHLERPLPGGVWDPATTRSGSIHTDAVIAVSARDNGNGGLDRIAVTVSELSGEGPWSEWAPIYVAELDGAAQGDVTFVYTMPLTVDCARLSFDVFSLNQSIDGSASRQLAPMGSRRYSRDDYPCPW
jgi:surface antigen